jgi:hypothetical protein
VINSASTAPTNSSNNKQLESPSSPLIQTPTKKQTLFNSPQLSPQNYDENKLELKRSENKSDNNSSIKPQTAINSPKLSINIENIKIPTAISSPSSPRLKSRSNIPSMPEHFVGRQVEVHKTVGFLRSNRCVHIFGPKQFGKTSVALAAAHYMLERPQQFFKDGLFFVSLSRAVLEEWCALAAQKHQQQVEQQAQNNYLNKQQLYSSSSSHGLGQQMNDEHKGENKSEADLPGMINNNNNNHNNMNNVPVLDEKAILAMAEQKLLEELKNAMRIQQDIKSLAELYELIADWNCLLILDDCGHPFANSLVLQLLKYTNRLRLLLTSGPHAAIHLPVESGFNKALVCVKELTTDASVQLLRKLGVQLSNQDATTQLKQARGSPYQLRLGVETLTRAKMNKLVQRLPE